MKSRGFTLIELLVVIAIIGLLSSVVLASLNSAREKGANAAVKANMASMRSQAELQYDNANGSYDDVCTANTQSRRIYDAARAVTGSATVSCYDTSTAWAASAPLKTANTHWCVDSSGVSRQISAALAANTTFCPAS